MPSEVERGVHLGKPFLKELAGAVKNRYVSFDKSSSSSLEKRTKHDELVKTSIYDG